MGRPPRVDRDAARFAQAIARMEIDALDLIAEMLRDGEPITDWYAVKLSQFTQFERDLGRLTTEHGKRITDTLNTVLIETAEENVNYISDSFLERALPHTIDTPTMRAKVLAVIRDETGDLTQMGGLVTQRILRAAPDLYRTIVAESLPAGLSGVFTVSNTQRQIMRRAADNGLANFVDTAGRKWRLDTWAEMAARTGLHRATVNGQATVWADQGYTLAVVSDSPDECSMCRPFEREIVALDGNPGPRPVTAPDGTQTMVQPLATLDQAQQAGLHHPNCRHSLSLYIPGYTETGTGHANPDGYEAEQAQRALERQARKWERRTVSALDPAERNAAGRKFDSILEQLERHVEGNPDLIRRYHRETTMTI